MKRFLKFAGYTTLILVCLEIALQIYNPFSARLKNGRIVLPVNTVYELELPEFRGMDRTVRHSKNSLGFRGPELTDSSAPKIICMGGSTTECFYLNDGKDWPNVLRQNLEKDQPGLWLNNAGMDGHSSFGHLQLLKQYILDLKPDYIVMMCGLNDMSLDTPSRFDENRNLIKKAWNFLELPSAVSNIIRSGKARKAGLNHRFISDLSKEEKLEMSDSAIMERLQEESRFLGAYEKRLREIAEICKNADIKLILVSQSILYSDEEDLYSNSYLGNLKTGNINGKTRSYILKLYNKTAFEIAGELGIPFINLAARLPKDSRFYYDGYHFTNDGADMAAGIIYDEIKTRNLIENKSNGTDSRKTKKH